MQTKIRDVRKIIDKRATSEKRKNKNKAKTISWQILDKTATREAKIYRVEPRHSGAGNPVMGLSREE